MRPRKDIYKKKQAQEREFCLNHCPHAKASECRWEPKECMVAVRKREGRV